MQENNIIKNFKGLFWDTYLPLLIVLFCTFQPFFYQGFIERETGMYLPYINEVLNGKVLYRDLIILRGPLEIILPAVFMIFFGVHINVLSAVFYVGNVLVVVFAVLLARQVLKSRIFLYFIIPLLVSGYFMPVYYKHWGGIRAACGLAAMYFFIKFLKNNKKFWLFISGAVGALGFLVSIEIGVFSLLAIALSLLLIPQERRLGNFVYLGSGFILAISPFLLYIIIKGGFFSYLNSLLMGLGGSTVYRFRIEFPDLPANPISTFKYILRPFKEAFFYSLPMFFYLVFFCAAAVSTRIRKRLFNPALLSVGIYGFLLYLGAFRNINGPHFNMVMQIITILFFSAIEYLYFLFRMNKQKRVFINKLLGISLFVVIFYLLVNSVFRVKDILSYGFDMRRIAFREVGKTGHSKEKDMGLISVGRAEGIVVPLDQAEEINLVTSYIIANTSLGEEVFAFPDLGYYNFFADRPCLGRFCYSDLSAYRQEWFDELYSRLKDKKPRYVVYSAYIEPLEKKLSGYPYTEYRKKIREYLMSNYHIEKSFDGVDILRLGPGK